LAWPFQFGPIGALSRYKHLFAFNAQTFDKLYYQRENPDIAGLHPYVHFLETGKGRGALPWPPTQRTLSCNDLTLTPWQGELVQALMWQGQNSLSCGPARHLNAAHEKLNAHVSIIMPYYNRQDCVERAINSVIRQKWQEWTLIVIDDGSEDDGIPRVERRYSQLIRQKKIVILRVPHCGAAAARNAGLSAVQSDWVAYLDTDNMWTTDHLTAHMKTLKTSGSAWTYSDIVCPKRGPVRTGPYERFALLQHNYIDLNTMVHHRYLFDDFGGFDERLRRLIDYDLILRYGRITPPVKTENSTVIYSLQKNSISLKENYLKARKRVRLNHICERIGAGLETPRFFISEADTETYNILRQWGFNVQKYKTLQEVKAHCQTCTYPLEVLVLNHDNVDDFDSGYFGPELVILAHLMESNHEYNIDSVSENFAVSLIVSKPVITKYIGALTLYHP
jgi:glycosyltransferase involved in cell wall biosynthesis